MLNVNIGDTFSLSGKSNLVVNGAAQSDMTGWSLSAVISYVIPVGTQFSLDCNWVDATKSLFYVRKLDTGSWVEGNAIIKVTFTQPNTGYKITATSELFSVR